MEKWKSEIVFEDDHILVVEKPAFLLSIPDRFVPEKENLLDLLRLDREEVYTVHRLDRETSGIMVFAKTREAHRLLSLQFEKRTVSKKYLVLVDGRVQDEEGRIELAIQENPAKPGTMRVASKGKPSLTLYQVLERYKGYTLLEADIRTGRTHQIRVHFAAIGHPLTVDPVYGQREAFFLSQIKGRKYRLGKFEEERPLMTRTTLHAYRLQFEHPATGQPVDFQCEWPKDLTALIKQLRKWAPEN